MAAQAKKGLRDKVAGLLNEIDDTPLEKVNRVELELGRMNEGKEDDFRSESTPEDPRKTISANATNLGDYKNMVLLFVYFFCWLASNSMNGIAMQTFLRDDQDVPLLVCITFAQLSVGDWQETFSACARKPI